MIRITFEGTTQDVMKEMKEFIDNRAEGAVNEAKEPSRLAMIAESAQSLMNITQAPKGEAATVPEPTMKEYKLEELQVAMQPFINTKLKELQELLAKFQVVSLVDLPKEQYSAFAEELRVLGATI